MGRQRCIGCERPASVCLCSQLPSPPLQTRTCVVVLQHPHEARHKLSTLPVLAKCLSNCHVLVGRRFQAGCSPILDFFFMYNTPGYHALLLFPTVSAQSISTWFAHHGLQNAGCPCRISKQIASFYPVTSMSKEDKPTSEDLRPSTCSCQPVEIGNFESNTAGFETFLSQPDVYVPHESGPLLQRVASSIRLHSHSDLLKSVKETSASERDDPFSHDQLTAGGGNGLGQALDSQFQQPRAVARGDTSDTLESDYHGSVSINKLHDSSVSSQQRGTPTCTMNEFPHLVLIAVDATWQHAHEMIRASAPYLNKFAIPVCLPFDGNQEGFGMANSDLIMRKEPFKGCMTTLEAISCCLKLLECNGTEIHDKLTCVLRAMIHFQTSNIASHKVRMRQQKKKINRASCPAPLHEECDSVKHAEALINNFI